MLMLKDDVRLISTTVRSVQRKSTDADTNMQRVGVPVIEGPHRDPENIKHRSVLLQARKRLRNPPCGSLVFTWLVG